ncbi:Ig-like V-type domain-containing protein FAM187A [Conger conger]|uniref:Ig-like V-type domain-containing protein FAM187A n=1 Tax=Conger conger TaxID=82655 RepID=UPI002A5A7CE6|nr:Ig-like V-type domain-containing protein FAM187A [Conger conger]
MKGLGREGGSLSQKLQVMWLSVPLQLLLLLQVLLGLPMLLSAYEAPEDKEDVFAKRACPAFLVFESVAFLEDMTVELPCRCKPEQARSVVWYYQRRLRAGARALTDFEGTVLVDWTRAGRDSDLRGRFSIRLFSLLVFRARAEDSGHYVCGTASGQFFYGYHMDVQRTGRVSFPPRAPRAPPRARSGGRGLFGAFTSFWPWSVCDRCGVRGEQTRVGLCYLRSDYLSVRYIPTSSSPTSSSSSSPSSPSSSLPCGSAAVPPRFRLDSAAKKGAELAVRSCHAPCPPVPVATAERRPLLDFLGVSAEPPASEPPGLYHSHPAGAPLTLACPGAQPHLAVAWDRAGRPLYRARHLEGRNRTSTLHIDRGGHLHLRPVALGDQGTYTCWLQGRRAAHIHLGVYLRLGRSRLPSDPESQHALRALGLCYALYCLLFILLTLLRLFWSALERKRL